MPAANPLEKKVWFCFTFFLYSLLLFLGCTEGLLLLLFLFFIVVVVVVVCCCCCLCIFQPRALLKEAPEAPCWNYAQQTSTGQNPRAKRLVSVLFPHSLAKQRARSGVRLQLQEVSALGSLLLLSRCVCTKVHPLVLMLLLLLGPHFFSKGVVRESEEKTK